MTEYQQVTDLLAFIQRHPGHASQKPHGRRYGSSGEVLAKGHKRGDVVAGGKGRAKTTKKESKPSSKHGYLSRDMQKLEGDIAPLQHERAAVFDKQGKKLFEKDGKETEVTFSTEEMAKMRGAVVTHNHPDFGGKFSDGGSFSMSDAELMVQTGMAEVRAVTKKYIYRMRPKIVGNTNLTGGTALDFAKRTRAALKSEYADKVKAGKIKQHDFFEEMQHKLWTQVADQGFIEYERVSR